MKQWNGLMAKEWMLWKWQIVIAIGITVIGLFAIPSIMGPLTKDDPKFVFEMTMVFGFMVILTGAIIPAITFATMFNRDMKQPDIWLHSTASAYVLIGVKCVVAACIGAIALVVPALVLAIRFAITDNLHVTFDELAFFGSWFIVLFFATSLMILATAVFFIVIDRLLKPYLKGFSIVATGILVVLAVRLFGEIKSTAFYERFIHNGNFDLLELKNSKLEINENSYVYMDLTLSIGNTLFDLLLTVLLFVVAITLFEKKVRV